MKIGIPRSLLYYKYGPLWLNFFKYLDIDVIISPATNKKIIKEGIKHSIDEACLSSKIYMGHVEYLLNKCDFVLVPRVASVKANEELCVKFNALPDIVANTFPKASILTYNIDVKMGKKEVDAFIKLGSDLGFSHFLSFKAYKFAKKEVIKQVAEKLYCQNNMLKTKGPKVLLVAHDYNVFDEYVGGPIIKYLEELGIKIIYANYADNDCALKKSKKLSSKLYWTFNKQLLGAIEIYKNKVDGIIMFGSFPCGPDSLVNELVIRKVKEKPVINIIIDELEGTAGLQTRVESFIDIIKIQKGRLSA